MTIEAGNPPKEVSIRLPDNGIDMISRIAVDIQINFSGLKHSQTTATATARNCKAICKADSVFNSLHPLYF